MGIKTKEELRIMDNNELCDYVDNLKLRVKAGEEIIRSSLLDALHEVMSRLTPEDLKEIISDFAAKRNIS